MKLSLCASCGALLQFEYIRLPPLRRAAGLHPRHARAHRPSPRPRTAPSSRPRAPTTAGGAASTPRRIGCNWLVPADAADPRCDACRLNRNLADMSVPANLAKWRDARMRQAPPALRAARFGLPIASKKDGESARPRLRLPRGQPRRAGDDRPRQRPHHHQRLRGRLRRARAPAARAGRALPHAARPHAPRGRRTTTGTCSSATPAASTSAGRIFGDERESYGEALERYYERRPEARLGGRARQRLRDDAPLGGLRRDLDPLSAHGRHPRHRRELRPLGQSARSARTRATRR